MLRWHWCAANATISAAMLPVHLCLVTREKIRNSRSAPVTGNPTVLLSLLNSKAFQSTALGITSRRWKQSLSLESLQNGFSIPQYQAALLWSPEFPNTALLHPKVFKYNYVSKHNRISFVFSKRDVIQIDFYHFIFIATLRLLWCLFMRVQNVLLTL